MTRDEAGPPAAEDALRGKLDRVAAYEKTLDHGLLTGLMRRLGRTKGFAAVYSRVGPRIDPHIRDLRDGRVMARIYGFPILTLHSTGARTGKPRVSPLVYVRDGDDIMLIGTNFGQVKHPGWTSNLLANPDADVAIGPETLRVRATQVDQEVWDRTFPRFVEVYPGYADYMTRRGHLPPRMFRLVPVA
jgi:deazaflavin-dependent oxidoreductase (nitroreductase family)